MQRPPRVSRFAGKRCSRLRSPEVLSKIREMRKTMSWPKIGKALGKHPRDLQKIFDEEGNDYAQNFRPRVLAKWPAAVDFKPDEMAVRG